MISIDEVKYISKLAKIGFTDEESEKMAKEFGAILGYFQSIDKFDLSDINLNVYEEDLESVIREDVEEIFEERDKLFRNAKSMKETYIQVPKIIE